MFVENQWECGSNGKWGQATVPRVTLLYNLSNIAGPPHVASDQVWAPCQRAKRAVRASAQSLSLTAQVAVLAFLLPLLLAGPGPALARRERDASHRARTAARAAGPQGPAAARVKRRAAAPNSEVAKHEDTTAAQRGGRPSKGTVVLD